MGRLIFTTFVAVFLLGCSNFVFSYTAWCEKFSCAADCAGLNGGYTDGEGNLHGNNWCYLTKTATSQSLSYVACELHTDCNADWHCASSCDKALSSATHDISDAPYFAHAPASGTGGCSFRFDLINGYCWRYCSGSSGNWCYTSPAANCGYDNECVHTFPTYCKSSCAWNSDAGCVNNC